MKFDENNEIVSFESIIDVKMENKLSWIVFAFNVGQK